MLDTPASRLDSALARQSVRRNWTGNVWVPSQNLYKCNSKSIAEKIASMLIDGFNG
jgi:hypothetical protein